MDTVVTFCVRVWFPLTLLTLTPSLALLFRPLVLFALFLVPDYAVALSYVQTRAPMVSDATHAALGCVRGPV